MRRFGEYWLGRRVGEGGMAVVDAAYQQGSFGGRLVALKRVALAFSNDALARRSFMREASIATRLEHPNVVRTYEVGEAGGGFLDGGEEGEAGEGLGDGGLEGGWGRGDG